jgi:hypothetical protein
MLQSKMGISQPLGEIATQLNIRYHLLKAFQCTLHFSTTGYVVLDFVDEGCLWDAPWIRGCILRTTIIFEQLTCENSFLCAHISALFTVAIDTESWANRHSRFDKK